MTRSGGRECLSRSTLLVSDTRSFGLGSRRLRMSRPIISPTSPYSIGITERQPGTDGGNSLSSPGPAVEGIDEGTQIFWAGMSGGSAFNSAEKATESSLL
jgi:hypothetical protein